MKKENFSSSLMDKLAGELSENEAREFEKILAEDPSLKEDYEFFSQVWDDLGDTEEPEPSDSLSRNFYEQLEAQQEKEQNTLAARFNRLKEELLSSSPLARNISFGLFLLAFGFILGGKFNTHKIEVKQTVQNQEPQENDNFVLSTQKIQQINTLGSNGSVNDETVQRLKSIIRNDDNTNVRLAALNQLNKNHNYDGSLKRFYIQQLEREQSPLIQVELLNSIIENSKTKESIHTMENMLANRQLNPIVHEKIKKDLPVLRASYVE